MNQPRKNHKNGPCTGLRCPICKQQRNTRNANDRAHRGGFSRRVSVGGACHVGAPTPLTGKSAPMASAAFYADRTRERAEAEMDARIIADTDAAMDYQLCAMTTAMGV